MSFTRALYVGLAAITLLGALWIPNQLAPTPDEAPPFKPVARVSSLMTGLGTAFGEIRDVHTQTEEENRLNRIAAWSEVIAELSNVHMRHRREPEYIEMAGDTRSIALELARAARADEPDEHQLTTLISNLDTSCSTCHESDS